MNFFHLAIDLLFVVLARLPVKSLMRFRCVSKSWANLLDSPEFVKIQLNSSLDDSKSRKLIFETLENSSVGSHRKRWKLLAGNIESAEKFISSAEELFYPETDYEQGKRLVGCCNGVVCIRYVKYGLVLCNPWTRKHKKLPTTPLEIDFPGGRNWIYTEYGFGYDDLNDDYKVIKLSGVRDKVSGTFCNEVKVYSLKSNSWRRIKDFAHEIRLVECVSGVLVNGSLHWRLIDSDSVFAIDLRTEEHRVLPAPEPQLPKDALYWLGTGDLGVFKGCLCIWRFFRLKDLSVSAKVWLMMEDYEEKGSSWITITNTKEIVGLSPLRIVGYSESEEQLIYLENYQLWWYDVKKELKMEADFVKGSLLRNYYYSVATLVQPCSAVQNQIGRKTKRRKISTS